jgi:enoyl-CoA hydratase/carnithine racemase
MPELVRHEQHDAVVTVVLDRPDKRNAISRQMMEELIASLGRAATDDTAQVVIVEGEAGVFSAGWDRVELLDRTEPWRSEFVDVALRFYRALVHFPKPLIAAVESYALGTAFDAVVLCDVRVCSDATYFGHPEVRLGGACLYTPLKEVVGAGWARELCLSGRSVEAATAERIGLVNRVVPVGEVGRAALDIAREMALVPRETLEYTKSYLWSNPDPEDWLAAELDQVMYSGMTIQR